MTDRLLVLVRHGQSDWNLKNLFTGWRDVDLTEKGVAEAREAGRKLKAQGIKFDVAFTSALKRAQRTLDLMLTELGQTTIPIFKDQALNERDYGDLVGLLGETRKMVRSRCWSGAVPTTWPLPAAKA
jgi:2,3-bisphosphoglycerate-dependent phosphoglycerate mutase